jgi:hypothetical protein
MKQSTKRAQGTGARRESAAVKEMRAERFVLVDAGGRERARLHALGGEAVFTLRDAGGNLRLTMRAGEQEATLGAFAGRGETTEQVISLGYEPNVVGAAAPGLTICDGSGAERVRLRAGAEGGGEVMMTDAAGTSAALGAAGMTLWDAADQVIGEFGPRPDPQPPARCAAAETVTLEMDEPAPRLSEEKLWDWCGELLAECDFDDWAIDALILIIWNVANQPTHLQCRDLADRLTKKLHAETLDAQAGWRAYLPALAGKSYREDKTEQAD